jgi:hypothetical protein
MDETKYSRKFSAAKHEAKRFLERLSHSWENKIKMYVEEAEFQNVDCTR